MTIGIAVAVAIIITPTIGSAATNPQRSAIDQVTKAESAQLGGARAKSDADYGKLRGTCRTNVNPVGAHGFAVQVGFKHTKSGQIKDRYLSFDNWGTTFTEIEVQWSDSGTQNTEKPVTFVRDSLEKKIGKSWVPLGSNASYQRTAAGDIQLAVTGISATKTRTSCSNIKISQQELSNAQQLSTSGTKTITCETTEKSERGFRATIEVPYTPEKIGPIAVTITDWRSDVGKAIDVTVDPTYGKDAPTTSISETAKKAVLKRASFSRPNDFEIELRAPHGRHHPTWCTQSIKNIDLKTAR